MIVAALREQGAEVPADLADVPVWPSAEPYRHAFASLSRARGHGMAGPLPLAYSEILAYATAHGFGDDPGSLEEFVQLIQAQDLAYLKHHRPKEKA